MYPNLTNFQRLSSTFLLIKNWQFFPSVDITVLDYMLPYFCYFLSIMLILHRQDKFPERWIHDICA